MRAQVDGPAGERPPVFTGRSRALVLPGTRRLSLERRPLVMGVVNVTPDSFSDGGLYLSPEDAVGHALRLDAEGADIIDLGAESTRPGGGVYGTGADEVSPDEEIGRVCPVIENLRSRTDLPISIDTRKAAVARAAIAAGADLVNDVSALADPRMAPLIASSGVPVILMHSRGELKSMQAGIRFFDVVAEVRSELDRAVARAVEAGIAETQIVVDPGIGFGKTVEQNLELLCRLDSIVADGRPVLVGASRKSFIGAVARGAGAHRRLGGSLAAAAEAAARGAAMVRVHDVEETRQFLDLSKAIADGGGAS